MYICSLILIFSFYVSVFAVAERVPEAMKNSIGMKMLPLMPGSFLMGSPEGEEQRNPDEKQTNIQLSEFFYMSEAEVTQKQWIDVMQIPLHQQIETQDGPIGRGAKRVKIFSAIGNNHPMTFVSWLDAVNFCVKLTKKEKAAGLIPAGYAYNLPTEAQWEYACRAGTQTVFSFGDSLSADQANFYGPSPYGDALKTTYREKTTEVKLFPPNNWGLYDMHGNVYEWCRDFYAELLIGGKDPIGPKAGEARVIRGGTWNRKASSCRSAYRYSAYPYTRSYNIGFRVILVKTP